MKKITAYIVLLVLFVYHLNAQYNTSQINSGFVFINGKYIESPYTIETNNLAIFINNMQVTKEPGRPLSYFIVDEDPGMPKGVSQASGLAALDTVRGANRIPHMGLKIRYLYQYFPEDEAREKVIAYFRDLPYIRKVEAFDAYILKLEDFYGETVMVDISYRKIEPVPSRDEYEHTIENTRKSIVKRLAKGDCIFYFGFDGELSFSRMKAARVLPEALKTINNTSYKLKAKKSVLDQLGIVKHSNAWGELIIGNMKMDHQLTERLEKLRNEIIDEFGSGFLKINQTGGSSPMEDFPSERSSGLSYSPDGTYLYIYYGNAFDHPSTYNSEINSIRDHISDQDYNITTCIWYDATSDDNDPGGCTLANWKDCKNADVISIHSHGNKGFFAPVYLKDKDSVDAWRETEINMYTLKSGSTWWGDPPYHPYYVMARKHWVSMNWENELTQSKSIVIVNSCNSSDASSGYSFLDGCGGEVGFGYPGSCNLTDRKWNNDELFQRMNGTIGNGRFRTAGEAYANMPEYKDDFEMIGNPDVTLCPATKDYYPNNGDEVADSGTGFFQVDTYCHDSVPAGEVLTFETEGNVIVNNIHWVDSGQVNRIDYDWNGSGDFMVTVTVHHDKFYSWGAAASGYHALDFDGVAPNTEDGLYYFYYLNCPAPSNLSAGSITSNSAELSWIENSNTANWDIMLNITEFDTTGFTPQTVTDNPYVATDLQPATIYDFYVRTNCGGGYHSTWKGPATFQTSAENTALYVDSGQSMGSSHHTAVALGDLDGDGDLDAVITNDSDGQSNKVWLNDGTGFFTDSGLSFGSAVSLGLALGDLDDDGDLDGFIVNDGPNKVYLNAGVNTTDNGQSLGNAVSHGVALADLDSDGDLDVAVANSTGNQPNKIWLNDGYGYFIAYPINIGIDESWDVALGDLDGDYDVDGFVANNGPNKVYLNNGSSNSNNGQNLGAASSKAVQLGDLDGDGDLDAFVANSFASQSNTVWLNNGAGTFTNSGFDLGSHQSMCVAIADLDGDGDLDAYLANNGPNTVYLDVGLAPLLNVQDMGSANSYGVALGDLDGDGDLDAFVANYDGPNKVWLNQTVGYQVESVHPSSGTNTNLYQFDAGIAVENGDIDTKAEATDYVLENYPDPFTSTTTIKFKVGTTEMTMLKVYNTYGYVVAELYNGIARAGNEYFFTFDGRNMPEGIYILYLQSGDKVSAKEKMVLIK